MRPQGVPRKVIGAGIERAARNPMNRRGSQVARVTVWTACFDGVVKRTEVGEGFRWSFAAAMASRWST